MFSPDFCLHVWTFWGVLGARVGVFGGLGVLALVWLGLPCRFFPVSLLTRDRGGGWGGWCGSVGGVRVESGIRDEVGYKILRWCVSDSEWGCGGVG